MKTSELDYDLPEELIAQRPSEKRDEARMLILDRTPGTIREDVFRNIAAYLQPGDCLVLNDTRVIRARLHGHKPTGGRYASCARTRRACGRRWCGHRRG